MERKRADDEYKLFFQEQLIQLINQKYGRAFTAEFNTQLVYFIDALLSREKYAVWDELSRRMQRNRKTLYKFYHNTYKPSAMIKFSEEQLEGFATTAQYMAVLIIAENPLVTEKNICSQGISRARESSNFTYYEGFYNTTSAYHKMRNAILVVYQRWLDCNYDLRVLNNISLKFTGVSIDALMIKLPGVCDYNGQAREETRLDILSQTSRFQIYAPLFGDQLPVLQQVSFDVGCTYNTASERNAEEGSITCLASVPRYEENVENYYFVFSIKQQQSFVNSCRSTAEYSTSQRIVLAVNQDDEF